MTPECKRVKIMCLVSLFLGIFELIGSWFIPAPFGTSITIVFVPMAVGLLSLIMGVHGARAANVPLKAAGLRVFALIILLLTCGAFGLAVYMGHGLSLVAYVIVPAAVIDLLIMIFSFQTKRALDRA